MNVRHVSCLLIILLVGLLIVTGCGSTGEQAAKEGGKSEAAMPKSLLVYSGAGLRKPMDDMGAAFQEKTGIQVTYIYGGSAQLTSQILLTNQGDLCVPGDVAELQPLREKGLVAWEQNVVYHVPVLAVPKGNPVGIQTLADLARPGLRVALGDHQANPIGKLANKVLQKHGLLDAVDKNVVVRTATVNELVVYLTTGQADAAIIWEENYQGVQDKVGLARVPELDDYVKTVPVAVLSCSNNDKAAREFAQFLTSPAGVDIWEKWGYRLVKQ